MNRKLVFPSVYMESYMKLFLSWYVKCFCLKMQRVQSWQCNVTGIMKMLEVVWWCVSERSLTKTPVSQIIKRIISLLARCASKLFNSLVSLRKVYLHYRVASTAHRSTPALYTVNRVTCEKIEPKKVNSSAPPKKNEKKKLNKIGSHKSACKTTTERARLK